MMSLIHTVMLAAGGSPGASIVAKATVALALALMGARLARGSRAAARHALLAAAFGVMLALPIASIIAPPVRIAVPAAQELAAPPVGTAGAFLPAAPANVGVASIAPQSGGISPSSLLLAGWIAGMALFLLPLATGLWQVRSLRRSALPWRHGQPVVDALALEAGIHRRVEALLHEGLPGPMTCGVVHPAIVLPPDAQTWAADDLNRAIVHELEHVRRGDWLTHFLARAVCAVYWFHPLVWIARRQLALEAERSCDDAVLGRSEATAYADQLVGLARRLSAKSPLLAMANRSDLASRVGAVLDSRQRRGRAGILLVALACAAAAVLVATMAPVKVVAAQQSAGADASVKTNARFTTYTGLVTEAVTVRDAFGKPIEGLTANDFTLTEDGAPQRIFVFEFQKLAAADSPSSYYILGYYTMHPDPDVDAQFRKIAITCKDSTAKLDYRPGYYPTKRFNFNGSVAGGVANSAAEPVAAAVPGVTPPRLTMKVEPAYSDEARKAKFQGRVILSVDVDASGQVRDVKVAKSLGLGLNEKAIDAVKQWKFTPGMKDGRAVATQVEVEANFRLL